MNRMSDRPASAAGYGAIRGGIARLLQAARIAAARNVNALMTGCYWEIGRRIVEAEQKGRRKADYGDMLVKRLALDLTAQFGRGFGWRNLFQMRAFHLAWPEIVQTASATPSSPRKLQTASAISTSASPPTLATLAGRFPLPWSAYVRLLSVKNEQARRFYKSEALRSGWSVRQLDEIGSQFFERTALSRNKAAMLAKGAVLRPEDAVSIDAALKDPYGAAEAHYALEGLPNKVLAAQYQTVLPSEEHIARELAETTRMLVMRKAAGGAVKRNA